VKSLTTKVEDREYECEPLSGNISKWSGISCTGSTMYFQRLAGTNPILRFAECLFLYWLFSNDHSRGYGPALLRMRILSLVWQCNRVESSRSSRSSIQREDEQSELSTADSGQWWCWWCWGPYIRTSAYHLTEPSLWEEQSVMCIGNDSGEKEERGAQR